MSTAINEFVDGFKKNTKYLAKFLKQKRKGAYRRKGLVLAFKQENQIRVGVSLCNYSAGDKWDENKAFATAIKNASPNLVLPSHLGVTRLNSDSNSERAAFVPDSAQKEVEAMLDRADRYFGEKKVKDQKQKKVAQKSIKKISKKRIKAS